jgi:excisionase family DNA binding protein
MNQTKNKKDDLIKARAVATLFKIAPGTVYVWIRKGIIPAIRIGRTVRFRESVIQKALAEFERNGELPKG